jgi:uncharacterized membrane protein YfcA
LAPREGVASGSSAALSRSVISADSGMPREVPVGSSTTIVWLPLRSVGSKINTGPILRSMRCGGILGAIAAMPGPLVFIFLLAKGLRGKAFTKEASLHLVVSAGLLTILLTASRQFNWLDVSVSTAAMMLVVLGMYVGQPMRDKIAPEIFEKLVLIAVIAAGGRFAATGFFS